MDKVVKIRVYQRKYPIFEATKKRGNRVLRKSHLNVFVSTQVNGKIKSKNTINQYLNMKWVQINVT